MLKDSFLLTGHRLAKSVSTLIITMVLARVLSVAEMGTYQTILLITITLSALVPFEMYMSFTYFYNKTQDQKEKEQIISNTMGTLFLLGLLTFLVMIAGSASGWILNSAAMDGYIFWVALWSFALIAGSYLENLFVSTYQVKLFSLLTLGYYVIFFACTLSVIWWTKDLLLLVKISALLEVVRIVVLKGVFMVKHPFAFRMNVSLLKKQVNYTLAVGSVTAMYLVIGYTDKVLVNLNYSIEQFAIFAIAAREIPFVLSVTNSAVTAAVPKLSRLYNIDHDRNGALALWSNTSKTLALLFFPVFWVLLFYHKAYISIIFSNAYLDAAVPFVIYLLKFPLGFTIFYTLLLISGNQRLVFRNTLIVVLLNLVTSFIGLKLFGMNGVAGATVISSVVGIYLQQRDVCKVYEIRQRELLPYKTIVTAFLLSGVLTLLIAEGVSVLRFNQIISVLMGGSLSMMVCLGLFAYRGDLNLDALTARFKDRRKTA